MNDNDVSEVSRLGSGECVEAAQDKAWQWLGWCPHIPLSDDTTLTPTRAQSDTRLDNIMFKLYVSKTS